MSEIEKVCRKRARDRKKKRESTKHGERKIENEEEQLSTGRIGTKMMRGKKETSREIRKDEREKDRREEGANWKGDFERERGSCKKREKSSKRASMDEIGKFRAGERTCVRRTRDETKETDKESARTTHRYGNTILTITHTRRNRLTE